MKEVKEFHEESKNVDHNILKIRPFETDKDEVKLNDAQKQKIIPRHAFSAIVCGKSGSGKTMMLLNLLTRTEFYGGYFDEIYIVSDTAGEGDDLYKRHLKVKDDNMFKPDAKGIDRLEEIIMKQKEEIKRKGMGGAKKILIIFDDVAHKKRFLNSNVYLNLHIANRHYNISCFTLTQSYTKMPRACRCNVSAVFFFHGCTDSETERLSEEHCPARYRQKEFKQIVEYATLEPYSFLFINKQKDMKERYIQNLDTVLALNK